MHSVGASIMFIGIRFFLQSDEIWMPRRGDSIVSARFVGRERTWKRNT